MFITIHEALQIESLKPFKIVAGRTGLTNKIKKIGILDYETEHLIEKNFVEGEFVISSLLVIKDNVEALYKLVKKMISVGVGGLAIKNIYFDTLPDEVIALADEQSFPIMIFSHVYFEDIITSIMNAVKEKQDQQILSLKIDHLLYGNLDHVIIKKIAYEINRNFEDNHIVAYCKRKNNTHLMSKQIFSNIDTDNSFNKIIPYKDGYVVINTFKKIDPKEAVNMIMRRFEMLGFTSKEYVVGISGFYEKLSELNYAIKESIYAHKHAITYKNDISLFNEIGTNKVLLPLIDNEWLLKYHDDMIEPLLTYDKSNDTALLKTAIVYIENNGDMKATATQLFQHNNTIRYRINKINTLLNKDCLNAHFYEELALAIRIHNLLNVSM